MKHSLKYLLILVVGLFLVNVAYGLDRTDYWVTYVKSKPVRLKFTLKSNDLSQASVQYWGQKNRLPLVLVKEEELRRNPNSPSLTQIEWAESIHKKQTGRYIMVVQGAVIDHFIYERSSDRKVFFFDQDEEEW
jgi:hypothetical protein